MNDESKTARCPKCNQPVPAEAPQGLCPKCLYEQACIPTEAPAGGAAKAAPPTIEELAAAFPQLEIVQFIGQGGMGFVFKARQPKLDRFVALKILPQSMAADPAFAERFTREARLLARLNHPNLVAIHDFGQEGGFFYLIMEYVDGVNLRQAMKAGRFTPAQALAVVPKICEALEFAHSEGVLHRDIKPENILLDSKGRVKIADFGIAKLLGEQQTDISLTASGAVLGTPTYMAPEQLERSAPVDQRADIYSLGVVFYEMLTGELPIGHFQPPSQKAQMDARLDEVVLHALEKEPERRYQSANQVKTAVENISSTPPGKGSIPPLAAAPQPPGKASFWKPFFIAVLLLVPFNLVVVGVGGFIAYRNVELRRKILLEQDFELKKQQTELRKTSDEADQMRRQVVELRAIIEKQQPATAKPNPAPNIFTAPDQAELVLTAPEISRSSTIPLASNTMTWYLRCFVPPGHTARLIYTWWTNGIPTIYPSQSSYIKVGQEGGIDLVIHIAAESEAAHNQRVPRPGITSEPQSGASNVFLWNVILVGGISGVEKFPMPPHHKVEPPKRVTISSGQSRRIPLVEFEPAEAGSVNKGFSGIELRLSLEPLFSPPIRMLASEVNHSNYIVGQGLIGSLTDAMKSLTNAAPARDRK